MANNDMLEYHKGIGGGDVSSVSGINNDLACQQEILKLEFGSICEIVDVSNGLTLENSTSHARRALRIFRWAERWTCHMNILRVPPNLLWWCSRSAHFDI